MSALQGPSASFTGEGTFVVAALVVSPNHFYAPVITAGPPPHEPTYTVSVDLPACVEWRPSVSPVVQSEPPRIGELLVCLLTKPENQQERLGCYIERYHEWDKKFGVTTARRLYIIHAMRSVWDIVKIAGVADLADRIWNWFQGR